MRLTVFAFSCAMLIVPVAAWGQQAYPGFSFTSSFMEMEDGNRIHYVEEGEGEPVVLVHGAPAQAFLWRNIIPHLSDTHRVIALDLPNFGLSDKVGAITMPEYTQRFGQFIDELGLEKVTLVVHDIGGPIALNWANDNRERVRAVSLLETFLGPIPNIAAAPPFFLEPLNLFDPAQANEAAVTNNGFVEGLLLNPNLNMIQRELSAEEQAIYRAPFDAQEKRIPLGNLAGEIAVVDGTGHPVLDPDGPGGAEPATHPNLGYFTEVSQFLREADIPKQLVQTNPGGTVPIEQLPFIQQQFPDFKIDIVGDPTSMPGLHFVQEDLPQEYGQALSDFADTLLVPEPSNGSMLTMAIVAAMVTGIVRRRR